ncbi:MAG: T9SS type A sorting domain-containing protein [Bacteroidota bacterium]
MKNLLLLPLLCLGYLFAPAQPLLERILSNEIKFAISDGVQFDDGNWMFSAFAYSVTPGDSAMAIVLKTDSTLTPLWAKRYKYLRRDDFSSITRLHDGNVLVGGTMRQTFSLQDGASVYKLDTAGNVIWHLMYEEDFDDRILDIFEQKDSSLMVFVREGVTNQPINIIHATPTGSILSERTYTWNSTFGVGANTVVADSNERYYYSGQVFTGGLSEVHVCAVDQTNQFWYKRYVLGGRTTGCFVSAYMHADSTILLSGTVADSVGIFVNIWLMKIDLQGNVIWAKEYGRDLNFQENPSQIIPLPNGEMMMFGRVFDEDGSQGFAMRLDAQGNVQWIKGYNPTSPTFGIGDVFPLSDGRYLLSGNSGTEAYMMLTAADGEGVCFQNELAINQADISVEDSTYAVAVGGTGVLVFNPPLTQYDISIEDSLLCAGSVGIPELVRERLEVYPNPASEVLHIQLPSGIGTVKQFSVVDTWGRTITVPMVRKGDILTVSLLNLPAAFYWVLIQTDEKRYVERFVKK